MCTPPRIQAPRGRFILFILDLRVTVGFFYFTYLYTHYHATKYIFVCAEALRGQPGTRDLSYRFLFCA